ncbi:uncharacterized protein LTR77_011204 [Saxophila tyrrhenica]|uniref:BTB domain-containing protein n=1 Tax=Saxophila tyrrhenica TaxID=1690608 RepID=A0AAV9NTN1_9PEZI|nr:hypothetical protein LTR77_011204 [Saxophila tyrrhenica]
MADLEESMIRENMTLTGSAKPFLFDVSDLTSDLQGYLHYIAHASPSLTAHQAPCNPLTVESVLSDRDGDVCFIVHYHITDFEGKVDTSGAEVGFWVSSKVLSLASPVFAALLGPKFREGNELAQSSDEPLEIPLPDDDATGLAILFGVLHYTTDHDTVTLPELAATSRLVDKYQCQNAFRHVSGHWLEDHLRGEGTAKELPEYLGIAVAFGQPKFEGTVVMGIALTTGKKTNTSTVEERIKDTMLVDLVSTELSKDMELFRESWNAAWTRLQPGLISTLYLEPPPLALRGSAAGSKKDASNQEATKHGAAILSAFCRALHNAVQQKSEYSLLHRALSITKIAKPTLDAPEPCLPAWCSCNACMARRGFSAHCFELFMSVVGRHPGRTSSDLSNGNYVFSSTAKQSKQEVYEYSEPVKLLFGHKLAQTLIEG